MRKPSLNNQQQATSDQLQSQEIQNSLQPSSESQLSEHSKSIHRKQCYIKLTCIVLLVSGFVLYRFGNFININTSCITDAYQEYSFSLNRKLYEGWDDAVLGIGQVIMDFWICFSAVFWYLFVYNSGIFIDISRMIMIKNMRFPIAVFTFYMVRSGIMLFTKFPFPQNMVWHDPGFPSLTVPYDRTRDFFFSGHTGALVLIMLQFSQLTVLHSKKPAGYVWIIIFVCLLYIMNMLIVTRVHYTIDVVGGLIFSFYSYWLIGLFTKYIDQGISVPYKYAIKPLIQKVKERRNRGRNMFEEDQGTFRGSINDRLVDEAENNEDK